MQLRKFHIAVTKIQSTSTQQSCSARHDVEHSPHYCHTPERDLLPPILCFYSESFKKIWSPFLWLSLSAPHIPGWLWMWTSCQQAHTSHLAQTWFPAQNEKQFLTKKFLKKNSQEAKQNIHAAVAAPEEPDLIKLNLLIWCKTCHLIQLLKDVSWFACDLHKRSPHIPASHISAGFFK